MGSRTARLVWVRGSVTTVSARGDRIHTDYGSFTQHVVYGPLAIAHMAPALRAAHATMVARGYTVRHGVMCPATLGPARRSKDFVLGEMFEAAVSDRGSPPSVQTSIPGVDDARKAG